MPGPSDDGDLDKLVAAGYRVSEIEADDGAFELELVDRTARASRATCIPATGEPLLGYDAD